ncbi:MAG: D-arabinono-1,4-lactone oxidase [Sclerophora amabilis]|nr:MAG: D-arabinono-1,4-lactone oxidase [Sclerophora amabilis]
MDPIVQHELSNIDPAVPFRSSENYHHSTWAGTFHSRPELYIRPHTTAEIQKAVRLASRCRRRLTLVGRGHSPSDLTCTSGWMMNLDEYNQVLSVDDASHVIVMQSGIRLHRLGEELKRHNLTMPNLGSIDEQAIAGAIATATHGSTLRHGILSQSVLALKIVLADGRLVSCSPTSNLPLFRAALVSLGALGVIAEVTFQAVPHFDISWSQTLVPLSSILSSWEDRLWTQSEFVRVWWLPYLHRGVLWRADKTTLPHQPPEKNWYGGALGFHSYHIMLYLAHWVPRILPTVEWFVFGMQYGFSEHNTITGVEEGRTGLLMNCLYSQFVNEWAIPLRKGPEALTRMDAWINGDQATSRIPISPRGIYVHAPIEVRVADTSTTEPRPFLDNTLPNEATLYLNATLYRPYGADPPCRETYYAAFEYLMRELGGRPHWAKNFSTVTGKDIEDMYGADLEAWREVRDDVDPDGVFVGDWHRRYVLAGERPLDCEEREFRRRRHRGGGWLIEGGQSPGPGRQRMSDAGIIGKQKESSLLDD